MPNANSLAERVRAALAPLVNEASHDPENELLSLACALESAASAIRAARDEMQIRPIARCCDCGRAFSVPITVERERRWGMPDNCPPCWKARTGHLYDSVHAKTFRYEEIPSD